MPSSTTPTIQPAHPGTASPSAPPVFNNQSGTSSPATPTNSATPSIDRTTLPVDQKSTPGANSTPLPNRPGTQTTNTPAANLPPDATSIVQQNMPTPTAQPGPTPAPSLTITITAPNGSVSNISAVTVSVNTSAGDTPFKLLITYNTTRETFHSGLRRTDADGNGNVLWPVLLPKSSLDGAIATLTATATDENGETVATNQLQVQVT